MPESLWASSSQMRWDWKAWVTQCNARHRKYDADYEIRTGSLCFLFLKSIEIIVSDWSPGKRRGNKRGNSLSGLRHLSILFLSANFLSTLFQTWISSERPDLHLQQKGKQTAKSKQTADITKISNFFTQQLHIVSIRLHLRVLVKVNNQPKVNKKLTTSESLLSGC